MKSNLMNQPDTHLLRLFKTCFANDKQFLPVAGHNAVPACIAHQVQRLSPQQEKQPYPRS